MRKDLYVSLKVNLNTNLYYPSTVLIHKVYLPMEEPLMKKAQEEIGTTKNAKMTVPLVPRPDTHIRIDGTVAVPSTDKYLTVKVR
jgi:hypothetical protein